MFRNFPHPEQVFPALAGVGVGIDNDHVVCDLLFQSCRRNPIDMAPRLFFFEACAIANEDKASVAIAKRDQEVMRIGHVPLFFLAVIANGAGLKHDVVGFRIEEPFKSDGEFSSAFANSDFRLPLVCLGSIGKPDMVRGSAPGSGIALSVKRQHPEDARQDDFGRLRQFRWTVVPGVVVDVMFRHDSIVLGQLPSFVDGGDDWSGRVWRVCSR